MRQESDYPMPEPKDPYRGVRLKRELIDDIEKWINEHPNAGYSSIADFASEAIRLRVQELKGKYPSK